MQDRTDFPIEDYERHLPRLRKRAQKAQSIAIGACACAGLEAALFGVLPGHPKGTLWLALGLAAFGWISSLVKRDATAQHDLIRRGGRPTGVWMKLVTEQSNTAADLLLENELRADMDHVVAVAERKALTDTASQWWRQEGSLWHQTQKFIDATDSVIETHEEAERQAAREERRLAYERDIAEAKARLKKAETERRIAATQRWIDEQREWDAFVEDSQVAARERKERGDWYEPPVGVPGAIDDPNEEDLARKVLVDKIADLTDRINRNILASYSQGGITEIHSWDSVDPVRVEPAAELPRCARTGKTIYTGPQAHALLANMRPMNHYRTIACAGHYHLVRVVR